MLRAQIANIGNALYRTRALIGAEFLIAEYGEAFFQAKLKPVATGNAVTRPIVEIFMRDDRFDIGIIRIGRGFGARKHIFVVENIEPFILHRAHIEVGHSNDVEHIKIIFAAKGFLVPAHRADQRIQRVASAVFLAAFNINSELNLAA